MTNDLARIVHIFDDSVTSFPYQIGRNVNFNGMAPKGFYKGEINWKDINEHYGITDENPDWNEKIAALRNPEVLENYNGQILEFGFVTSRDVLAARKGVIPRNSFYQIAAIGITKTLDDKIIVGIRGGEVTPERIDRFASGLYGTPPGGSVTFEESYDIDPITDTIEHEFYEEIGSNFNLVLQKPIGIFEAFKPGPTGYKFVSYIETDFNFEDIKDVNDETNKTYKELKLLGTDSKDIKYELKSRGLPADAWEHYPLESLANNPIEIKNFLELRREKQSGISQGALMLYANWLERK